ncbi:O-antigen ligase family protein [Haloprofundus salinisoli]|uniref:O-antigen ligase family protein n=1 Tax=Haloprofundus salinisoli TaxID=2876193 RepID=UPI001CCD6F9F|nr:O-antigen ligase family protein [Haloprofundus salinisoli]
MELLTQRHKFNNWDFSSLLLCFFVVVSPLSGFAAFVVGNTGIQFTWIVGVLIIFAAIYRVTMQRCLSLSVPIILLICWLGWICLTGIAPLSTGEGAYIREYLFGVARFGFFTGVVVALANLGLKKQNITQVFQILALVATLVSLYAVYQFFARQYDFPFAYLHLTNPSLPVDVQVGSVYYTDGVFARVSSVFMEPSWLGIYLLSAIIVVSIPIIYGMSTEILFSEYSWNKLILSILSLAFIIAYSLGAYFSFVITLMIFVVLDYPKVRSSLVKAVTPPITLFVIFDLVTEQGLITRVISARIFKLTQKVMREAVPDGVQRTDSSTLSETTAVETSQPGSDATETSTPANEERETGGASLLSQNETERSSLGTRVEEVESSLQIWSTHPISGVGINNFQFYSRYDGGGISFVYSLMLAEQGIVGLSLFLAFSGYLLFRLFNASGGLQPQSLTKEQLILRILFYIILAAFISSVFRSQPYLMRFWFYIGISIVALTLFTDGNRQISLGQYIPDVK